MQKKQAAIAIFLTYISLQIIIVTAFVCGPTFQRVFGLSDTYLGLTLSAASTGVLAMSLVAGHLTYRAGSFPIIVIGMAMTICGLVLVIFADGFWMLLMSFAIIGISLSFVRNAMNTLSANLFGEQLRRFMALAAGLWFGSAALTAPVVGAWLEIAKTQNLSSWSFRIPYLFNLVLILICLFVVCQNIRKVSKVLHTRQSSTPNLNKRSSTAQHSNRLDWLWTLFLGFCHGMMIICLMAWMNPMIQDKFGANDFQGALLVAIVSFALAVGRFVVVAVPLKFEDRTLLAIGGLVGGSLVALGLFAWTYILSIILLGLGGLIISPTAPCILSLVGRRFPEKKSHVYGYMGASVALAGLLGPSLVGALADSGILLSKALLVSPLAACLLGLSSLLWKLGERSNR